MQAFALGVALQRGKARAQHGDPHERALAEANFLRPSTLAAWSAASRATKAASMSGGCERHGLLRQFAVVMHQLGHRLVHQAAQRLDGVDGAGPVMFGFVDADQRTQGGQRITGIASAA